jgi:hypothetical protein
MKRFIVFVALAASACATSGKFERTLQTWVGSDVNPLLQAWGPPSDVYTMPDGHVMYTWLNVGGTHVTSNYNQFTRQITGGAVTIWCKTTFTTTAEGTVQRWRWQGNACRQ